MKSTSLLPLSLGLIALPLYAAKVDLPDTNRQAEPIIQAASGEAELAATQIVLPEGEGLEVSVWASEPLFANAVAFDFDEQGRAFFSETHRVGSSVLDARGYPDMLERDLASRTVFDRAEMIEDLFGEKAYQFGIEGEIVRLVEDSDGDGKADTSSIFADGFNTPLDGVASGVMARKGDVYFTNIPHLWKFETDETGRVATRQESLLYGFGVHFGFIGHDLHGLAMGPDGKLYFSVGDRGANVMNKEGKRISFPDEGGVYRSNLDGTEFELVHRGLRNPQELAFDEYGNLLTGDNDCDNGDFERLVHIVDGGDSGWRIGHQYATKGSGGVWISEGWWKERFEGQAKFLLPPVCYINDGPSGIAYYPGTGLTPDYSGHLFITHFKGSTISSSVDTYTLKPMGASFELDEHKPFMKSLLPTDVSFAPDGKLYVLDWVSGWGKTGKGRLFSVSHPNHRDSKIVKETEQYISEGMEGRSSKELNKLLSHPNWNVRLESQYELANRGTASQSLLSKTASDSNANLFARLHATWGLGQLANDNLQTVSADIVSLAKSSEDEVRAQAIKLIGDHKIEGNENLLISALGDTSARVKFFAAQSIGKLKIDSAAEALLELARENNDADLYLRHAIVMGLAGGKNHSALEKASKDNSKAVRTAALLTYRMLGDSKIASFLKDSDKELVFEAARAINDTEIVDAFPALAAALESPHANDEILGQRALNAHFRLGGSSNAKTIAAYANNNSAPESLRIEALKYLASWANPHPRDRVIGLFRPIETRDASLAIEPVTHIVSDLLRNGPAAIQRETIAVLGELGIDTFSDELYALVKDESQSEGARITAFNALDSQSDSRMEELVTYASQSNSPSLRLATLPYIAKGDAEQAEALFSLMIHGSVEERRAAYKALSSSDHDYAENLLVESVNSLTNGEVPYAAQLELLEAAEASSSPRVAQALSEYNTHIAADPDPIAPYRFAIDGGSGGWGVYNQNQVMACVRCHIAHGPGEAAGPNLRSIGFKDREYLLEAIVAPNARIAPGFETTILTLKDGTTTVGVLESEDDSTISLKLATGESASIEKTSIASRIRTPSTMPDVFKTGLSRHDLRDVVEYLSHLKEDPNGPDRSGHGGH